MGKTIEELFKTKKLADGKTAAEKYEIRDSKDMLLRSSTGAMDLPFKVAQIARRNLSSRLKETRLEEETTGLRIIAKAGAPIIYGTSIFKLSTQKTEEVTVMKDSVNPQGASQNNGVLGNLFNKAKDKALQLTSKIGIKFPTELIPTRISLNPDFKAGKEPDTMTTLAKIKGDGAGNLVGKLLAKNATGTPKQIGNQVLGAGINLLKGEIKKKLFGAPKQGAQNLAKKGAQEVQYDSSAKYSDTINPNDEDYFKRNDLSSILVAKDTKYTAPDAVKKRVDELVPKAKDPINISKNPFAKIGDKLKDVQSKAEEKLSEAKKQGQQAIANGKKIGDNKEATPTFTTDTKIKYSDVVDETADDVKLRNDLSTKLDALNAASNELKKGGAVQQPSRPKTYSSFKNTEKKTLSTKLGIESGKDFLNEKTAYVGDANGKLQLADKSILDDYDFIPFKFSSVQWGTVVNFRATLTGVSETISPSWDSAKFIGSPFNYYTYSGIERSLSFNFKVYSLTPAEHIAAWQRLNYLTGLAYPQFYPGTTFIPPFVKITIGNLYKNKECFIESLSYTIDDNTPWEVGPTSKSGMKDNAKFKINGDGTSIDEYKLPTIIDVSCTVKLVESKSSTIAKSYYGFDRLPRLKDKSGKALFDSIENPTNAAELSSDLNNTDSLKIMQAESAQSQPKENVVAANSPQSNPAAQTTTGKQQSLENTAAPKEETPPSYKIEVSDSGDGWTGKVYANGKLIQTQEFITNYSTYGEDGKTKYTGQAGVKEYLRFKSKIMGWYGSDGKQYPKSNNVS